MTSNCRKGAAARVQATPRSAAARVRLLTYSLMLLAGASPAASQTRTELSQMSLDSLLSIPVHSAARYAQALTDAPAAVTVITAEEIAAFGYRTLDQVLARAAGFYINYDRNYTYVGVRGFARPTDYNNRVLLLLNGHPINESVFGSAPIGNELGLDLSVLERVEVVRGPISALYGTNAMFAVVNLITMQPTETGAALVTDVGDAGYRAVSGTAHVGRTGARNLVISAMYGQEDGRDLYFPEFARDGSDGIARDLDWARFAGVFASARLGDLRLQARVSNSDKGVPTAAWETVFNDPRFETRDGWAQFAGTLERAVRPNLQLTLNLTSDYYWYSGFYPYESLWQDATTAYRFGTAAQVLWDASARNRVVAGVGSSYVPRGDYRMGDVGEEPAVVDRVFAGTALYVQDEMHLRRWVTLVAGGRLDWESDADAHVTPRAALILRPTQRTTLKALHGTAFRTPNVFERLEGGAVAELRPESIRASELIAEHRIASAATVRVSVFYEAVNDIIEKLPDPNDPAFTIYENAGCALTRGVETELTMAFGSWLIHGGGVLQSAVNANTDGRLTNAPRGIVRLAANGRLPYGLSGAAQVRGETGRLTLNGSETSAFGLVDLNLAYRPTSHVRASVSVQNALDRSYAYPGGSEHVQDAIPQDGRRLRLRVEIHR